MIPGNFLRDNSFMQWKKGNMVENCETCANNEPNSFEPDKHIGCKLWGLCMPRVASCPEHTKKEG